MSTPEPPSRVWDCERMFRKRCPQSWRILDSTPVADVRHCRECDRDVHLCRTPAEFVAHGERGHCVAIPEDLFAPESSLGLGQPSPEAVVRERDLMERGIAWWDEALLRQTSLKAEKMKAIRRAWEIFADSAVPYSPEHIAVLRMAVRDGGVPCPHCGSDIAEDEFGIMFFLAARRCLVCQGPIELGLAPE